MSCLHSSERLGDAFTGTSARQLLERNPYTPTRVLAERVVYGSRRLSELHIIAEWLKDTAPAPTNVEIRAEYRMSTKRHAQQRMRQGINKGVTPADWMDPDATNRPSGGNVDQQDAVSDC